MSCPIEETAEGEASSLERDTLGTLRNYSSFRLDRDLPRRHPASRVTPVLHWCPTTWRERNPSKVPSHRLTNHRETGGRCGGDRAGPRNGRFWSGGVADTIGMPLPPALAGMGGIMAKSDRDQSQHRPQFHSGTLPPWEIRHYETAPAPRESAAHRRTRIRLNLISRQVLVTAAKVAAPRLVRLSQPRPVTAFGEALRSATARGEWRSHRA